MSNRRRVIIGLAFVTALAAVTVLLREHTSLDVLIRHEGRLRDLIARHTLTAWLVGLGIYYLTSLVPGTGGKSIVFGWLFGLWPALVMIDVALTLAALTGFLVSRYLIRDFVESRFAMQVYRLNDHLHRDGTFYLLFLRMVHVPFTFMNYVCGALQVPPRTFWWTTQIGLIPGTFVFVFAGTRLPTLKELAEEGPLRLLDPWLIAGLLLTAVLPILIRQTVRHFYKPLDDDADSTIENSSTGIPTRPH